jgi:ribosomal protein L16 Arg81 hydroxylase
MDFLTLIQPLSIEEFAAKVKARETFVMQGEGRRDFSELLSLDEIETALNNGCNVNKPVEIIGGGVRRAYIDRNIAWSEIAVRKAEVKSLLEGGHSFLMMNMTQINPKVAALIDAIETRFKGARADLHLYISPTDDGTGYRAHRDRPQHKIYLQVIGKTSWQIFDHSAELPDQAGNVVEADEERYLTKVMEFTMRPGDVLYMPPARFHKVRNHHGPRVSFSIPFVVNLDGKAGRMDRTHIPFRAIFENAMTVAAGTEQAAE